MREYDMISMDCQLDTRDSLNFRVDDGGIIAYIKDEYEGTSWSVKISREDIQRLYVWLGRNGGKDAE